MTFTRGRALTELRPRPFLKWAGGKNNLLPIIVPALLAGQTRGAPLPVYIEPFLGGGAVFFALHRLKALSRIVLGDRNRELIATYVAVRDAPGEVLKAAAEWETDADAYYAVRELDPAALSPVVAAARVLYLNRNGFNGLYRLNSAGRFNVPHGRYAQPQKLDAENLHAASEALKDVELVCGDFDEILAAAPAGAVAYLDPPYWPVSETSKFNFYDGNVFGEAEQKRLAATFHGLAARGVRGVLSNSWVPETCALYADLPHRKVHAARSINSKAGSRGEIAELLAFTDEAGLQGSRKDLG